MSEAIKEEWTYYKYSKTRTGFLNCKYKKMKQRVTGGHPTKRHLYLGLEILPKEDFISFTNADESFNTLFKVWEASGYDTKLTPSINRIDSNKGYTLDNIEWITHSENSRLGIISRHHGGIN